MPHESWLFDHECRKKLFFPTILKNAGSRNTKQDNIKIEKINLFLWYKERTKYNVTFSIIKQKINISNKTKLSPDTVTMRSAYL